MALGCPDCYEAERNHGCCPYGGYCNEMASHGGSTELLTYYDVSPEERDAHCSGCEHWDNDGEYCREVPCF